MSTSQGGAPHDLGGDGAEELAGDAGVAQCPDDDEISRSLGGRGQERARRLAVDEQGRRDGCGLLLGYPDRCRDRGAGIGSARDQALWAVQARNTAGRG